MKVLVTGGAGFIGSHVVDTLVAAGADVIVVDSLDPDIYHAPPAYLHPGVDYCFTDLRSWRPDARFDDVEAVVHLAALGGVSRAAREPANVVGGNVTGTARLVEAMRSWPHLRTVVLTSSFSVYGAAYVYRCRSCGAERDGSRTVTDLDNKIYDVLCRVCRTSTDILPLDETAEPAPLELYGASKYMQELCFRGFESCPAYILRQSSIYGTRLRLDDGEATIIARIAGWVRDGHRPPLLEDGMQIRDWVHVDDVTAAALAIILGAEAPPILNVCTGVPTRLKEACATIAEVMASDVQPDVLGGYRPGDMRHCLGDPGHIRKLLGRDPIAFEAGARLAFGGD